VFLFIRAIVSALIFLLLTGCYVPLDDHDPRHTHHTKGNPLILDARAGCAWNYSYSDYVWYFDAWVDHEEGFDHVYEIWADVWDGHVLIDSLPLRHDRVTHWDSQWREWTETNLWCEDYMFYEVEFFAYDWDGNVDIVTIWPNQY